MAYGTKSTPKVYNLVLTAGSTKDYPANQIDFEGTAIFCQITNRSNTDCELWLEDCQTELIVEANSTQVFNRGELHLTHIAFSNTPSGEATVNVSVVAGVVG